MDNDDTYDEHDDDAIEHDLDITLSLPLEDGFVDEQPAPQAIPVGRSGFIMDIRIQSDIPDIGDKIREASDKIEKG
jgi:hypothetical protein